MKPHHAVASDAFVELVVKVSNSLAIGDVVLK